MRTGGMIVFDTRDGNVGSFGTSTPMGRKLQQLARPLDIPALEPIPSDHVLTRAFYLLQDFPGFPRPLRQQFRLGGGRASRRPTGRRAAVPQPQ